MDSPAVVKYTITKLALQHYLTAVLHRSVSLQHYLTPGEDDFYFQNRDYMVNDVAPLGEGGFGTCVFGQNRSDESVFAMKRNNRDDEDKIDSIRSECRMLARIRSHDNVIKFLGAVVDEETGGYPPRVCKMFMELAESKSSEELHYPHRTCPFVRARCSESSEAGAKARPQLPCQASTPMPGLNSHARPQLPCQSPTPMPGLNSHARPQLPCQAPTPMPGLNSHARPQLPCQASTPMPVPNSHASPQLPCQAPTPMPGPNSHARPQLPCQASTPMPGLNSHARPQLPCQAPTPMPGLNSHARPQLPCQASTPMPGLNSHARPQLPCQSPTPMPVPNSHASPQLPCQASTPMPGLNSHARPQLPCQASTPMPGLNSHARPQLPCQSPTPMPVPNSHASPQLPCQASTPMPGLNSHARPQLPCQASTPMPGHCVLGVTSSGATIQHLYRNYTELCKAIARALQAPVQSYRALQAVLKSHSFTKMIAFSGFPLWISALGDSEVEAISALVLLICLCGLIVPQMGATSSSSSSSLHMHTFSSLFLSHTRWQPV